MESNKYAAFVNAYDNLDISALTDEELQEYADLCDNGLIEANRELYERGL